MGSERTDLVVYLIRHKRKVIYIGQGTPQRAYSWFFPNKYKSLGLKERPTVEILASNLSRSQSHKIEVREIKRRQPTMNYWHNGGKTWNYGLRGDSRCRGGRPPGIPMSDEAKQKLSKALKGMATTWMIGRTPWNKGLTKNDPRVAKGIAAYAPNRQTAGVKIWKTRRRNQKLILAGA